MTRTTVQFRRRFVCLFVLALCWSSTSIAGSYDGKDDDICNSRTKIDQVNVATETPRISSENSESICKAANRKVIPPRDPFQLLSNIKYAVASELLVQECFYSLDLLSRLIVVNKSNFHKFENQANNAKKGIQIFGRGFGSSIGDAGSNLIIGKQYTAGWEASLDGKQQGVLHLDFESGVIAFQDVEKYLGKDWTEYRSWSGKLPSAPTALYGNYQIYYDSSNAHIARRISVTFDSAGTLSHITINIKEK